MEFYNTDTFSKHIPSIMHGCAVKYIKRMEGASVCG
jgi:hypothetical protein